GTPEEEDLLQALKLVNIEYKAIDLKERDNNRALKTQAQDHIKDALNIKEVAREFGALIPLADDETTQLKTVRGLVSRYLAQAGHDRPLSLAVFGPPGSGKTFAVKQILSEPLKPLDEPDHHPGNALNDPGVVRGREGQQGPPGPRLGEPITINLTQLSTPSELTSALITSMVAAQEANTIPVIFFDEFDTTRNGVAYGWLSWFLAPMHDGEFFHEGKSIKLKNAIYVFAGGTASTIAEFTGRQGDLEFRNAKGPDFVSRLRGYLDVVGPNASPSNKRRALVLRNELENRVKRYGTGTFTVDVELLRALLQAGRYRHGARSIAALIELCELKDKKEIS